jgi:hypothetical protein
MYAKSASLQTWLLGYEFPETIIVIGNRQITVLTSKKKGAPPPAPRCRPRRPPPLAPPVRRAALARALAIE